MSRQSQIIWFAAVLLAGVGLFLAIASYGTNSDGVESLKRQLRLSFSQRDFESVVNIATKLRKSRRGIGPALLRSMALKVTVERVAAAFLRGI